MKGEVRVKKPFVFINCAMSLDGKISTHERRQVRISNSLDLERVDRLRAGSDAVLVGLNTVVSDDPKLDVKSKVLREERVARGLTENPMKVAVGRIDRIPLGSDFLNYGGRRILFTTKASDEGRLRELGEKAEVHVLSGDSVDLSEMLRVLVGLGVGRLMVEGGGRVNFGFLRERLVDEIYVAVASRILGGGTAPTLVDGAGFDAEDAIELELLGLDNLQGVVVLRYNVMDSRMYI